MSTETEVAKAIRLAGGRARVAEQMGVTYEAVRQWEMRGVAPARRTMALAALTGTAPAGLCPEVFGTPDAA